MKYCDFNGCTNKISKGRYCVDHKRSKPRKKKEQKSIYHHENKSFYNSKAWDFVRTKVYEREKGYCQRCSLFVFGRNAHVHHIIPVKENPLLKLEENNLMLLCSKCHTIVENEDNDKRVFPSYFG
jgi:5-methylcytosine-specific restriction enzyme A